MTTALVVTTCVAPVAALLFIALRGIGRLLAAQDLRDEATE